MPSPVGEGGSRRLTDEAFFLRARFCRRQHVTPHPPLRGPPVSLRLGHTRALSLPQSEIQSPRAASLPAGEDKGRGCEDGRSVGMGALRVVGAPTPTGENKNRRGTNMPSPVGEDKGEE